MPGTVIPGRARSSTAAQLGGPVHQASVLLADTIEARLKGETVNEYPAKALWS